MHFSLNIMLNKSHCKGIVLVSLLASVSLWLGKMPWLTQIGLSTLTLAIILGIVVGNTLYPKIASAYGSGVVFVKSYLLKLGIILYGFHLTFAQIGQVGVNSIIADAVILCSTFGLTYVLGHKVFKLDQQTAILLGAGCSICGAAAVLATEPVIKASSDKVAVAIAVVVIFGTGAIFLYPAMYHWGLWHFNDTQWGLYIGSSVHEVAQVYAAGKEINPTVADMAVTTKMIRVMMLAPFLVGLSFWLNRQTIAQAPASDTQKNKIVIPWFALLFIGVAGFNSLNLLPASVVNALLTLDNILLAMAMVALGLTTHISAIQKAGAKPMLLGGIVMVWLVVGGGIVQCMVTGV